MHPSITIFIICIYFSLLFLIAYITSRKATNATFFLGNRKSPWFLVAFGMIGASLSGVTFISVPGDIGKDSFSYFQVVLGYLLGYMVIAYFLLPLYYRLKLTSIYTYLEQRFGIVTYKTGASIFLISRMIGASFRVLLSANVLQYTLFNSLNIPYWLTVILIILFIFAFTINGGIKTVVWTDTIQTTFMLASLIICIVVIAGKLNFNFSEAFHAVNNSKLSKIFFMDDWKGKKFFLKQFLSGIFITITMTGLDQDMMQKNLSCKNIKDAKKNMFWFSITLVPVNLIFLVLGAMLYIFVAKTGMILPAHSDDLFPMIAMSSVMPSFFSIIFLIGLISSTYSSADSALTALTTSFTLDILNIKDRGEKIIARTRKIVHIIIAVSFVLLILFFKALNNQSVISNVLTAAGFTYGPLLGIYAFGLFTNYKLKDQHTPIVAVIAPVICFFLNKYSCILFNGYQFCYEILIINGLLTFIGLWTIREK